MRIVHAIAGAPCNIAWYGMMAGLVVLDIPRIVRELWTGRKYYDA